MALFYNSLQEYAEQCNFAKAQKLETPDAYYLWKNGRYFNVAFIILFFLWMPFIVHSLQNIIYPFVIRKLTYKEARLFRRSMSRTLYEDVYGLVLGYFQRINRKVKAKISLSFMRLETFEHLHLLTKVFKWVVFPSTILYGLTLFFVFGINVLDAVLLANLLFFYSNFVPDLPAIFRRKLYRDERDQLIDALPKYKTYLLLLFAPLFILPVFFGRKINWKTTETFHNFKSFIVYGVFLCVLGFLVLLLSEFSFITITKTVCVLVFGLLGYLTHLKVDIIF